MNLNDENTYDFFFHCWIDDNIKFEHSPWSKVNEKDLFIGDQNEVKNNICQLYKPLSYLYEKPLDKNTNTVLMDIRYIKNSLTYHNTPETCQNNIYNTLSQIYSRNQVKNILEKYIKNTETEYNIVISARFDGHDFPKNLKLTGIQKNKIYTHSMHRPRYIIPDNFLIIPTNIYLNWFNLYKNIPNITNNKEIEHKMNNINETFVFNMEGYLLSNYLYCGYDVSDIVFINYEH